ncbi:MAG: hypothetical protein AB1758_11715 [Candidatus Eremiobacterota bacterium]
MRMTGDINPLETVKVQRKQSARFAIPAFDCDETLKGDGKVDQWIMSRAGNPADFLPSIHDPRVKEFVRNPRRMGLFYDPNVETLGPSWRTEVEQVGSNGEKYFRMTCRNWMQSPLITRYPVQKLEYRETRDGIQIRLFTNTGNIVTADRRVYSVQHVVCADVDPATRRIDMSGLTESAQAVEKLTTTAPRTAG